MRLDSHVTDAPGWTVVIPVKVLSAAKSRMATVTPATSELAFAFFQDTLEAALASTAVGEVVVATADDRVRVTAQGRGCTIVSDIDHPGINAAVRQAVAQRSGRGGVAIVVSDLPAVTADALTSVLSAASEHPTSFLADADGTGTTMWMSCDGTDIDPRFGVASRAVHADGGAVDLIAESPAMAAPWASARRDVDTDTALADAIAMGVGRHTADAVGPAAEQIVTVLTHRGHRVAVVDEDGHTSEVAWSAVVAAGLLDLHPGQRIVLTGGAVRLP